VGGFFRAYIRLKVFYIILFFVFKMNKDQPTQCLLLCQLIEEKEEEEDEEEKDENSEARNLR
jgi:amino acid permease